MSVLPCLIRLALMLCWWDARLLATGAQPAALETYLQRMLARPAVKRVTEGLAQSYV